MHVTFALDEIDAVAKQIIPYLVHSKIVVVNGEMGAGKTTLIQAVCRQLGVTDQMTSPTFPIIQQYKTIDNTTINHIDVYRLKDAEEAVQAGVEDAITSGDFCFIEWPQKIINILPLRFINIYLEPENYFKRKLTLKY
jgi:tRNA threonylcarbamoyladenosine biosynthesis protein TsaE